MSENEAKTDKKAAKAAKGKKKGKKGSPPSEGGAQTQGMSVAAHPRAAAQVRRAKGFGGLGAFGATAYLSLAHGVGADIAGARALAAGAAGYIIGWGASVMVWRQLMIAELRARVERARALSEAAKSERSPASRP